MNFTLVLVDDAGLTNARRVPQSSYSAPPRFVSSNGRLYELMGSGFAPGEILYRAVAFNDVGYY